MAQEITEHSRELDTVRDISSAALAFLGDSVYETYIRERIVLSCGKSAGELNRFSKALTNAKAQAQMADELLNCLTEEESAVFRRGRNRKSLSVPASCSVSEYRRATGLEALMGFLYLEGRTERIRDLLEIGIAAVTKREELGK